MGIHQHKIIALLNSQIEHQRNGYKEKISNTEKTQAVYRYAHGRCNLRNTPTRLISLHKLSMYKQHTRLARSYESIQTNTSAHVNLQKQQHDTLSRYTTCVTFKQIPCQTEHNASTDINSESKQ